MSRSFSNWWARFVLSVLFFYHLIKRVCLFWRRRGGFEQFMKQYHADGILPVSARERALTPSYQSCQTCSLCTFSCTAVQKGTAPSDFEPKFIMLGYGRSPHESEIFLEEWLPCLECETCHILCPNEVPIHAMASQIIERRKRLGFRQ